MSEYNKVGWPDLLELKFAVGDITTNYQGEKARVVAIDRATAKDDIACVLALVTNRSNGIESSFSFSPNGTCSNGIMAYGDRGVHQYKEWNLVPLGVEDPEATPKG